jgi:hypothetical protein
MPDGGAQTKVGGIAGGCHVGADQVARSVKEKGRLSRSVKSKGALDG